MVKSGKLEASQVLSRPSENSSSEATGLAASRMQNQSRMHGNSGAVLPGNVIQRIIQNNMDESKFERQRQQAN